MRFKMNVLCFGVTLVLAVGAVAQMSPDTTFVLAGPPPQVRAAGFGMRVDGMEGPSVKGAPFCATVATEHTQLLADGNRIHTSDSSLLCRDSEGRTRREAGLNLMGGAPQTSAPKLVTIVDPVAGVRYLLDPSSKTAHKMTLPTAAPESGASGTVVKREGVYLYQHSGSSGPNLVFNNVFVNKVGHDAGDSSQSAAHNSSKESLGEQTINGVQATGTRITTVIPAGKMGNEKPITITSEQWYSSDLKTTVMTLHNDPWAGELKTEFKNVNTAEPDASLFSVPSDYKIVEDKEGPVKIEFFKEPVSAQ